MTSSGSVCGVEWLKFSYFAASFEEVSLRRVLASLRRVLSPCDEVYDSKFFVSTRRGIKTAFLVVTTSAIYYGPGGTDGTVDTGILFVVCEG